MRYGKSQDGPDIEGKTHHWIGDHWVNKKTGYCTVCDGPCDNRPKRGQKIKRGWQGGGFSLESSHFL